MYTFWTGIKELCIALLCEGSENPKSIHVCVLMIYYTTTFNQSFIKPSCTVRETKALLPSDEHQIIVMWLSDKVITLDSTHSWLGDKPHTMSQIHE